MSSKVSFADDNSFGFVKEAETLSACFDFKPKQQQALEGLCTN